MKKTQVTKEGFESLKRELDILVKEKRPEAVDRLSNARSQGDLAENSDYHNAKDELEFLDGRIAELEDVVQNADVIDSTKKNGEVLVGTKVTLKINGNTHIFDIVGEWEADPAQKKISNTSPLGRALVGKKKGDNVEVEAPAGKVIYEVLSIE